MKTLFENARIGNLETKNRFVRSATWENMATETGHLTQKIYDIYETLAKADVGLIITGYANVVPEEKPNPGMFGIYEDSFIPEYQRLTDSVHQHGSKIILQVAYGGTKTTYNVENRVIFAPSEIAEKSTNVVGTAMTTSDIKYIIDAFAKAGKRAKEAGFDGIEIHGAHTYLINQFLSPYYNQRTDEYGGSLENRMRFLVEIYEKTREMVGKDFPIIIKLTCTEFFDEGLSFDETIQICKHLEMLGVDALEITGNIHGKAEKMTGQQFDGYEIQKNIYFAEYAKKISSVVNIPIILVGGIKDYDTTQQLLNNSNVEFFALSRPLLTEPQLIERWKTGDRKKVKCIRCSKCRTSEGNFCVVFR